MFRSLRHRNLRLYLGGQFVSLIGTWMQQLAVSWLAYQLTHSSFWLGMVVFAGQVPTLIVSPITGVLVDRVNLHRLLKWTQGLAAIQAILLTILTFKGWNSLNSLLLLSALLGLVNAIDMPTRQAFVVQLLDDKKDLGNAIALNSSVMNATRLIGPAVGGVVITLFGEGVCFLANSVSYLAVLFALNLMTFKKPPTVHSGWSGVGVREFWVSFQEGLHFVVGFAPIGTILLLLCLASLIGLPYVTLFPAMVDHFYGGGAKVLGLLTGATGCGALLAAFVLASKKTVLSLGRWIGISALVSALGLMTLPWVREWGIGVTVLLLLLIGFATMIQMGGAPFGSLLMGTLAEKEGIVRTLVFCGGAYFGVGVWYCARIRALDGMVEPIYRGMGIIGSGAGAPAGSGFGRVRALFLFPFLFLS